jgi:hypothetical protein
VDASFWKHRRVTNSKRQDIMKKATKTAAPEKAPVVKKAPAAKKTPAKRATTPAVPAPTKSPAETPAPVPVPATGVVAGVDVGFGNQLFIRGEGPGLSWEQGVLMECVSSDSWTWSTKSASRPFAYKVLVNDEQWALGDDFIAEVGVQNTISPAF